MNAKRMWNSNDRLCMAQVPIDDFVQAVEELVKVEKDWVPSEPNTSLYIRPFIFATESCVGAHPAKSYEFIIVLSPVGAYYETGLAPVKNLGGGRVCTRGPRRHGFTKCGGNYAVSLAAQRKAEALGYHQVLWLDGVNRKYVEEVGAMNMMFKIDGEIWTAPCEAPFCRHHARFLHPAAEKWGTPSAKRTWPSTI
jgi:branched-chain amino acid aminotransferase